ncbi:uncharacterized protein [Acropora muricata]|uniref:uncharacterized protein isoform X2 n=1 Tax=Acropora muricata TaxID=159855 RepID=UPI0034E39502
MAFDVCGLQEHDPIHGSSKLQVTILASEWESTKGVFSTINRELAIQLAKFSCVEVTFFLPKCSDEDKRAAASRGVSILEAVRRPGYDELDWLSFPPEHLRIDVVVGHGENLGHQARVIVNSHKCKWLQFVHSDLMELGKFKFYESAISREEQKHHVELELCQMADFVVGVGPKLTEAFRKCLSFCKRHEDVFEFTPGLFDDFSTVQQVLDERKQCSVLIFDSGDGEDFESKGFDIAARSVAALHDSHLVFMGMHKGKHEEIAAHLMYFGIPPQRLWVRGYMDRGEALKRLFCEVDLVLIPSRTEGFGLIGLEALSAGLPVLVSKNSCFGEALCSVPYGFNYVIDSEEPSTWTAAIKIIWDRDRESRLEKIKVLRESYAKRYSWSEQCKHLIGKMFKLVDGTSSKPGITAQAVGAWELKLNEDVTDHSPCVLPKTERGIIIEKNESELQAGTSSEPETTAQGVEARELKQNKNFTGGSSKLQVTILASEWGSSKGELSTINRELAIQLAKFSYVEVTFFLPKCSHEDKKAAASHGVSILEAVRQPGYYILDWLSFPPEHLRIDVVVGHGVKLGHQAQVIVNSHKCKWLQFVHSDPMELGKFKCYESAISIGEQKHHVELELCQMADFVVGVGPKLTEAFRKYLSFCKRHQDIFEFTPGIFDDFSSVQQIPDERKRRRVLVIGRGDTEDLKLKGFDIAARSVAAMSDTVLVLVGAPDSKHEEIAKRFVDFGFPEERLRVRGYVEREALKRLFCEVDLVLMPSRTEGFGVIGLEALSAGLPALVGKNSGFGEALLSVRFGSFFVIDSQDPSAWTAAIKSMWTKDRKIRLTEIVSLRDMYGKRYSWSEQCKHLIEKMFKLRYASDEEEHDVDEGEESIEEEKEEQDQPHEATKKKEKKTGKGSSSEPEITVQAMEAREQKGNKDFMGIQESEQLEEEGEVLTSDGESETASEDENEFIGDFSNTNCQSFVLYRGEAVAYCALKQVGIHLISPPGAVAEGSISTIRRWNPRFRSPLLFDNEAVVSDVIELSLDSPGALSFDKTVKLVIPHCASALKGYEVVVKCLSSGDEWKDVETADWRTKSDIKENLGSFWLCSRLLFSGCCLQDNTVFNIRSCLSSKVTQTRCHESGKRTGLA